jgi:hypothetical protein
MRTVSLLVVLLYAGFSFGQTTNTYQTAGTTCTGDH